MARVLAGNLTFVLAKMHGMRSRMYEHERLEQLLGVPIYFCNPYHSWEKGTVENYNRQVGMFVPKGADISGYSVEYLQAAEDQLNGRYMQVLGYKTRKECLDEYRQQQIPVDDHAERGDGDFIQRSGLTGQIVRFP